MSLEPLNVLFVEPMLQELKVRLKSFNLLKFKHQSYNLLKFKHQSCNLLKFRHQSCSHHLSSKMMAKKNGVVEFAIK
jgi:hypothetical protein